MTKTKVFFKKNLVSVILGVIVLVMFILLITQRSSGPSQAEYYPPVLMEDSRAPMAAQAPEARLESAQSQDGLIEFCFRLDGQGNKHLPALMGSRGPSVYDNGISGVNWKLAPGSSIEGNVGVLEDGRIFVKKDFLILWGMQSYVDIISSMTGWSPVRMQEATIDGEVGFIY